MYDLLFCDASEPIRMRTKRNGCMEFAFNDLIVIIEFSFKPSVQMTSFRKDIIFDVQKDSPLSPISYTSLFDQLIWATHNVI